MEQNKLSMYGQYIYEREGKCIIETGKGFATYAYMHDIKAVYLEDLFVVPEHRRSKAATELVDAVAEQAKLKGYNTLVGSVAPKANGSTDSLKAVLSYGMKLHSCDGNLIWFKKELI